MSASASKPANKRPRPARLGFASPQVVGAAAVERVGLLAGVSAEPTAMTAPAPELQVTTSERACMLASENAPVVLLPSQTDSRFRSAVVNSDGVEHKAIVLVDSGSNVKT
jgi:hypothetical protein